MNNEANYVYTNKGKLLSDDLVEMILKGEHVEVLDTEEFECKFYTDYENNYDFARVSIQGQEYLIFVNGNQVIGFNEFDENLISESIVEYKNDKAVYDVVKLASLCAKGFQILSFDEHIYTDEGQYEVGFKYNDKSYVTTITATMSGDSIITEEDEVISDLDFEDLMEVWQKNKSIFDIVLKEVNSLDLTEREQDIVK